MTIIGWTIGLYFAEKETNLFMKNHSPGLFGKFFLVVLIFLNLFTFSKFTADVNKLEQRREYFLEENGGNNIFPRFWDQGFIGVQKSIQDDLQTSK